MAVVAGVAWGLIITDVRRVAAPHGLPWPLVAAGIVAAALLTVNFSFRKGGAEIGLQEVPLVVGVVLLSPLGLLLAVAVAHPLASVLKRRPPSKAAFNAVNYLSVAAAALATYHAVLGGGSPIGLRGWEAGAAAVAVADLASVLGVSLAVTVSSRRAPRRELLPGLRASMAELALGVLLALIAVTLIWTNRNAGLLVFGLGSLAALAQRSSNELRSRHSTLERLYQFTEDTGGLAGIDDVIPALLGRAREVMGAEEIELALPYRDAQVRYRLDTTDQVSRVVGTVNGGFEDLVAAAGMSVLAPRGSREPARAAALLERGLRDAIAAPIVIGERAVGILIVGNRGGPATFDDDDRRLFEALAAHCGVSIRGSRLLDELRREVVAREHEALHDGLTGLANRTLFTESVRAALSRRPVGGLMSVMLMDLDGFKEVNDTLGHHTGDAILREVAARLTAGVGSDGLVARLGGDEFAIVTPTAADPTAVLNVARRALDSLARPLAVDGLVLGLRASLGVSLAPQHGEDASVLLQRADVAMYSAKTTGGGIAIYDPSTDHHSTRRLILATELRRALDTEAMELWFQPQADLRSGAIVACEALLRWHHPLHGSISPVEFIPAAEQSGVIGPLTWWVLDVAIAQVREWHDQGLMLGVAVNISARSLLDSDLVERLERKLDSAGVAARWLTLEITESSIMADPDRSEKILGALGDIGVQLAIDDFGTGYSSLSRLKRLPIDAVKIDKSFVTQMSSDDGDAAIVRSTIDLARNLGRSVVAEGVEDQDTWDQLRSLGCDYAQGYHLARAMPAAKCLEWLQTRRMGRLTLLPSVGELPVA